MFFLQKPLSFHVPHSRQLHDSKIYSNIAFIDKKKISEACSDEDTHGLIYYIDTKCRHLKKFACKET
jgi:hypothetical protein